MCADLSWEDAVEVVGLCGRCRQAVQDLFKVKVLDVSTMNVRGKFRRQRTKQAGQAPDWKKAIVTLKKGDKIVLT